MIFANFSEILGAAGGRDNYYWPDETVSLNKGKDIICWFKTVQTHKRHAIKLTYKITSTSQQDFTVSK